MTVYYVCILHRKEDLRPPWMQLAHPQLLNIHASLVETDGNVNARDSRFAREGGREKGEKGDVIASDESLPQFLPASVCVP